MMHRTYIYNFFLSSPWPPTFLLDNSINKLCSLFYFTFNINTNTKMKQIKREQNSYCITLAQQRVCAKTSGNLKEQTPWIKLKMPTDLWPTKDIIKNIDQHKREGVEKESHQRCPEREGGSEATHDSHYHCNDENDQHFRWKVPNQSSHVNKSQENW